MSGIDSAALDRIAGRYSARPVTSAMTFAIDGPGLSWHFGDPARPHFIASVTKLYTAAVVMQLCDSGDLALGARAADVLGEATMRGLNRYGGRDHGTAITVRDLLANTSGIPDYFTRKRLDGTTLVAEMLRADTSWTCDDAIEVARALPSPFAPSTPGKAQYSDTNFQLLGRIIEVTTGGTYERAVRERVIEPLGLRGTWLFTPATRGRYDEIAPMLNGRDRLRIPGAMASTGPDGGMVSTPNDGLRFLKAFLGGDLFPAHPQITWNRIFSPFDYGVGLMRFAPPRWFSPLAPMPPMIGHSGANGTVLFHIPERELFIFGTINQFRNRSLPYRIMLRLIARLGT